MPRGTYKRRNKLMQPTSVQLDRRLHLFLQRRAAKLDTTMGALIRKILNAYRNFELGNKGTIGVADENRTGHDDHQRSKGA